MASRAAASPGGASQKRVVAETLFTLLVQEIVAIYDPKEASSMVRIRSLRAVAWCSRECVRLSRHAVRMRRRRERPACAAVPPASCCTPLVGPPPPAARRLALANHDKAES